MRCELCETADTRKLGGHTFLFPILQQTAFVTTHVGIREGVARYDIPDLPIGAQGTRDILLTGVQQTADLGLRITPWLGLTGFIRGTIVTGANTPSLLADGASVDLVGQAGAVVRLWRNESSGTQIAVRALYGYRNGKDITVLDLVNGILGDPLLTLEDVVNGNVGRLLVAPTSEQSVTGGVYGAQALGPVFSLQGAATTEYAWRTREPFISAEGRRVSQETNAFLVNLSLALAVDFDSLGVPVAVMGEYLFTTGEEEDFGLPDRTLSSSTLALGVYYSGRANLQVGVGAVTTLNGSPQRGLGAEGQTLESGDPTLSYGQLILRYIW
ncbi:hypothetical protein [Myxococcus sp. RHSTA-1-4]|uniref:hypothetical protein n=1 Tax=Myxococcus sp. RHSTA-1-4 TaxID=2874601 RepID=UPI001CBEDD98|nr:hypothetical protein [Myxococcus sp. RHSTA-1-4]MBZ4422877.1 hypothetical protein [Myxococcus sp. RHSTA-1-4]